MLSAFNLSSKRICAIKVHTLSQKEISADYMSSSIYLNFVIYLAIVFHDSSLKYSKCYLAAAKHIISLQQIGKSISRQEELQQRWALKEACDTLRPNSMTSRGNLTLPFVQIPPPGWVRAIFFLPLVKAGHTFSKTPYSWLWNWLNPKPLVCEGPVGIGPLHHPIRSGWSWSYQQEGGTGVPDTEEPYFFKWA